MSATAVYHSQMDDTQSNTDLLYHDRSTTFNDILARGHPEGDTTWGLVNLIGLTLFLTAVLGPIAYVTFCCRRPVTGERCLCGRYWQKAMGWFWWQPQHLTTTYTGTGTGMGTAGGHGTGVRPSSPGRETYDPPTYEAVVSVTKTPRERSPPPSDGQDVGKSSRLTLDVSDPTSAFPTADGPGSADCDWTLVDCYPSCPTKDRLPSYEDYMSMVKSSKGSELTERGNT